MPVDLTRVFRQSDAQLVKLLQNIRRGEIDQEDLQVLERCCSETKPDSSAVLLYPRNEDVNRVNKKMEDLNELVYVYHASDHGKDPWKGQVTWGIAPDELLLCKGARVMLNKNLSPWLKLVNGATGTAIKFCSPGEVDASDMCKHEMLPLVKFDSGAELIVYPEK